MDKVRFGLVGTGHWAQKVHAPGLASHPGVDLVGVWGRDASRVAPVAERHGAAFFPDIDELFASVDAVAFAVPPELQSELALRAANAGCHLLVEKPIAMDVASADRLVAAVEANDLAALVFFTTRFVDKWESWLDTCIGAGLEGGRADWMSSHKAPGNPYAASQWRRKHGALWDVGPHMLAQLIPVLGPVADVAGFRGPEDLVHLVLTHEGGLTSRMSLSLSMPPAAVRVGVEFYGDNGWTIQPDHEWNIDHAYGRALGDLVDLIRSGQTRHRCDVRFGREVIEVIARCQVALDG
ncbi:MAG: oxidoreductase domain protein [Marmoricola sp.]|nr:oxidoreductase domain protein [Marmoricola sp.]